MGQKKAPTEAGAVPGSANKKLQKFDKQPIVRSALVVRWPPGVDPGFQGGHHQCRDLRVESESLPRGRVSASYPQSPAFRRPSGAVGAFFLEESPEE